MDASVSSGVSLAMAAAAADAHTLSSSQGQLSAFLSTAALVHGQRDHSNDDASSTPPTPVSLEGDNDQNNASSMMRSSTTKQADTLVLGSILHVPLNDAAAASSHRISPSVIAAQQQLQQEHDLSISPLTASSFHVMEREYNNDTWRMYNRIQASRSRAASAATVDAEQRAAPASLYQQQQRQHLKRLSSGYETFQVYGDDNDDGADDPMQQEDGAVFDLEL